MKITAIEPQKGDPNRRNIFADGKFVIGISLKVLEDFSLSEGDFLSENALSALTKAENIYKAKKKALNYLDYAEQSEKTMIEKLTRAGFSDEVARIAVDELSAEGIINDESYAKRYAYYLYTKKFYGRRRVVMELMGKGIDRDAAQEAADSQMPEDFTELIRTLALKRVRSVKGISDKDYDKVFAYLLRCGHEYGDIREVLSEIF